MKIVYIPNPQWIIHKDIVAHLEANIIKGQDNLIKSFKEQGYCYSTWNTGAQIPGSQIYYAMVMEFEDEIRFTVEVIFKGTQMMKSYSQQIQMREGYDKPVKELLGFRRMAEAHRASQLKPAVEQTSGQPWPLIDIIKKLIEGNRLLLNTHSYDGHGWEFLNQAIDEGEKVIAFIEQGGTIGLSEMLQQAHKEHWIPQYMETNFPKDKSTKHQEG